MTREKSAAPKMLSFNDLTRVLAREFERELNTAAAISNVKRHIDAFGVDGVTYALAQLSTSEAELERIATASYLHGNGFFKITLCTHPALTLRLHLWLPGIHAQENLHSHRWPLLSLILHGVLRSEIWTDSANTKATAYPEYLYLGDDRPLIPVGEAKVARTEIRELGSRHSYVLWPDELHRIVPTGTMTATFMCHPTECRSWARNIVVNASVPDVTPVSRITPEQLLELVNTCRHQLTNDSSRTDLPEAGGAS